MMTNKSFKISTVIYSKTTWITHHIPTIPINPSHIIKIFFYFLLDLILLSYSKEKTDTPSISLLSSSPSLSLSPFAPFFRATHI
jgi:hypothetical protein